MKVKIAAASEPLGHFVLSLANGRRIESSWRFVDAELARLIRIVRARDVLAGSGDEDFHCGRHR